MNTFRASALLLAFGLCSVSVWAAEADKQQPGRKVDEPLPETYEPLMGSPRNEDFSQELKQLRRLKEEQREQAEREQAKREKEAPPVTGQKPATKSYPIQEPVPLPAAAGTPATAPTVEEQGEELRIRD